MPDLSYREQLDAKRLETIRQMLHALPRSCADFIRSLLSTTSTLTRLAYTIDLGTFFDFALKELPAFASMNASEISDAALASLKPRDIEIYMDYLTQYYKQDEHADDGQRLLKNNTCGIMRKLSSLRSYFNYLFRTQRIPANIVALVPLPKLHEKPILLLKREEMEKLLSTIRNGKRLTPQQAAFHRLTQARDLAIAMLFLGTGIRVSECVGINMEDIDFQNNALLVTRKGGNQVILYFPTEVSDALHDYLHQRETITPVEGHEHAFFLSLQRRRITSRAVEKMVKKYALMVVPLKKRMSPHKLRSTYATNLYHATEDIFLVAEALGHSDVNTTRKHYASMSDARMRDAARNTRLTSAETATGEPSPDTGASLGTDGVNASYTLEDQNKEGESPTTLPPAEVVTAVEVTPLDASTAKTGHAFSEEYPEAAGSNDTHHPGQSAIHVNSFLTGQRDRFPPLPAPTQAEASPDETQATHSPPLRTRRSARHHTDSATADAQASPSMEETYGEPVQRDTTRHPRVGRN